MCWVLPFVSRVAFLKRAENGCDVFHKIFLSILSVVGSKNLSLDGILC